MQHLLKFGRCFFLFTCVIYSQYEPPSGYYNAASGLTGTPLRNAVYEIINDHTWYPYTSSSTDTWDILDSADQDPNSSTNILDVYKNASYTKKGGGNSDYNREHSWPKSYGFQKLENYNYPYTDCHALFLANSGYNSSRTNKPYDDGSSSSTENPTDVNNSWGGGSGTYPGNSNWTEGGATTGDGSTPDSGDKWETWTKRQGDVARALFYLDVRYAGEDHGNTGEPEPDLILTNSLSQMVCRTDGNYGSNANVANTADRRAYMGLLSTLIQWHADDPVDEVEQRRNHIIYGYQGNRNPFIDNPTWVNSIFGSPTTTVQFVSTVSTASEGDGTYSLTIAISNHDASNATSVNVALTGGTGSSADINNYSTQTVTFSAGTSADQTMIITISDDSIAEGSETLIFSLQSASGGNSAAVGSNDQFTLTINPSDGSDIFINEIDYDQDGSDNTEFIELCAVAGSYTTVIVKCINGSNDLVYNTFELDDITLSNESQGYGFYVLGPSSGVVNVDYSTGWISDEVQNGAPDAVELWVNGSIVDAVSYESTEDPMTDSNGGSLEQTSGLSETNSTGNNSIGRIGVDESVWQTMTISPGNANNVSGSNDQSLPVELTSFIATPQKGAIGLSWITESEIDNLGFLIDRSLEPNSGFTTIADYRFVPELRGQGSVTYRTDYSYTDREVVPGTKYYYVLSDVTGNPEHGEPVTRHTDKMVSATPKWQDISSALINGFKTFKAYPNPFNPKTVIAYELEDVRELSVSIVDVNGRQVTELYSGLQAPGFHEFTWQPKDISAGIYFCHLTSGGNTITRKLVLLK